MESLEQRLSEIERRVFGHQNPDTLAALCRRRNDVSFVQELTDIAKECGNAVEARGERISPLFRRAPELDKYLDPGFAEEMGGVPTNLKADLILNREQMLKDVHEMLEKVVQRQDVINGEGFRHVSDMEPRLQKIAALHLEQDSKGQQLSSETLDLIKEYNETLQTLTEGFLKYDEILKREEAKRKK